MSEKAIYTPIEVDFADVPLVQWASRVALWELAGTVWRLNTPRAPLRYSIQEKLFLEREQVVRTVNIAIGQSEG